MTEMLNDTDNLKTQLLERVLNSPCPEILGEYASFQDLLDRAVDNEVDRKLSDPAGKYHKAIANPQIAEYYMEELTRHKKPVDEEEYFNSVVSNDEFGGNYKQFVRYKNGLMPKAEAVAFGKYFREAAIKYESDLRKGITPADMELYLREKLSTRVEEDFSRAVGGFCDEAQDLFEDDEKACKYVKARSIVLLTGIVISGKKLQKFKDALYLSIAEDCPILFFLPQCLRYYYDENGEQQVIEDLSDFRYSSMTGRFEVKIASKVLEEEEKNVFFPSALNQIGIPVKVVVPIMDHELLRPEEMNTKNNHEKIVRYTAGMAGYYRNIGSSLKMDIEVVSSINVFGIPSEQPEFREITNAVKTRDGAGFGVTNKTFMHAVDAEHERNNGDEEKEDNERNRYYRSREFAYLCRLYDVGEGFAHAVKMAELGDRNGFAGTLVKLPKGAEFDARIFNLSGNLIVFQ